MTQILIVEDDMELSGIMKIFLEHAGYEVICKETGRDALAWLEARRADLILLDVNLPDIEGSELCLKIRERDDCPIIYISCMADTGTIVQALERGGDDYLVKPVDYDQMLARIHAKLRRQKGGREKRKEENIVRFKQFTLDKNRHKVTLKDHEAVKEVLLSPIEYSILVYMSENPNKLLLYNDLYENVWDCSSLGDVRTVMVHVSNLRKKIDLHRAGMITSVRGAGYIFNDV